MKRKGFLILLILALAVLCLFSCKRGNDLPSENEYPEGAIALTTDNLFAYFDAEVTTRCQYDYGYGQTDVSSYVALVPRGEYAEIVGEISFELNAVVRQYGLSNLKLRVSNSTHRLRLESDGVTNTEINATVSGGGSSVTQELVPVEDSNSITLKSVTGYVILGEKKPYPHELITDSQRAESAEILSELRYRVEELKTEYDSAESFNYLSQTKYNLTSVFGEDLSVNRTATHKGVTVDLVNRRFKIGSDVYYVYNGTPVCQSLGTNGFVTLSKTGMTLDGVMSEYPPVWEIFDTGAVYFKEGENLYVAVTTLYDMSDGVFKQRLLAELADKGITTKYNRMTVRYEYGFDAGSLMLLVTVDYTDLQYTEKYFCRSEIVTQKPQTRPNKYHHIKRHRIAAEQKPHRQTSSGNHRQPGRQTIQSVNHVECIDHSDDPQHCDSKRNSRMQHITAHRQSLPAPVPAVPDQRSSRDLQQQFHHAFQTDPVIDQAGNNNDPAGQHGVKQHLQTCRIILRQHPRQRGKKHCQRDRHPAAARHDPLMDMTTAGVVDKTEFRQNFYTYCRQ